MLLRRFSFQVSDKRFLSRSKSIATATFELIAAVDDTEPLYKTFGGYVDDAEVIQTLIDAKTSIVYP